MTDYKQIPRTSIHYRVEGGRYIKEEIVDLSGDYTLTEFIGLLQGYVPHFIGNPQVARRDLYYDDSDNLALFGEVYCTPEEVEKIETHLAKQSEAEKVRKAKELEADRKEFERLRKLFPDA